MDIHCIGGGTDTFPHVPHKVMQVWNDTSKRFCHIYIFFSQYKLNSKKMQLPSVIVCPSPLF